MPRPLRVAGFAALLLAAAALAFEPVVTAGFVQTDLPTLVDLADPGRRETWPNEPGIYGALERASLSLSRILWTVDGRWEGSSAIALRIENLLLLLGAAAFARLALRRTLSPWTGVDGARAGAGACALLVACHPLAVASIATPAARGDLLALCLGAAAAATFLRGRQESRQGWTAATWILVLAAFYASPIAILFPPMLASLELFSGRRDRPRAVRLRTTATTLVVFGAIPFLTSLGIPWSDALGDPRVAWGALGGLQRGVFEGARDLGRTALPVPQSPGYDAIASLIAGAVLLVALQPAVVAARSAPRLWGWFTATIVSALLASLFALGSYAREPGNPLDTIGLLPTTVVACVFLAVAATSLSGIRRVLLPGLLAVMFVVLARGAASPWIEAGRTFAELRRDLTAACSMHGSDRSFLVVDPPGEVGGLRSPVRPSETVYLPSWFLHPAISGVPRKGVLGFVNEIPRAALYLFTRTREFEEQRMRGLVLLLRDDAAGSSARGRTALLVERQAPTSGDLNWNESLRSPLFDVAPLEKRAFLVRALPGASTARAPRMSWRAGDSRTGSRSGVWVDEDGVPAAVFDLATEFAWLFGDRVKRVWLESDIERIASAQVMADVPGLPGNPGPEVRPGGIGFRVDTGDLAKPIHGEARLTLAVLDLSNHRYIEVQAPAGEFQGGEILFPFPEGFPVDATHHGPHIAWSLEWRVGEACITRSFGELDS